MTKNDILRFFFINESRSCHLKIDGREEVAQQNYFNVLVPGNNYGKLKHISFSVCVSFG